MREGIVEHLVCPDTGAPLRVKVESREGDHILEGDLISLQDESRRFPIRKGVPRFAALEALGAEQKQNVDTFAFKWSRIPGYAHEAATRRNREQWYYERFGFRRGDPDVKDFLQSASYVLEAGTGTGVDTDMLVRNCSGTIFGIDISSAIDIAFERFRDHPRVALLQADIARLPFKKSFFDVVSCDQVLHHTAEPRRNFGRLVELLQPGGKIVLYVYVIKGPIREFSDDYLRNIFTRAPLEDCLAFSDRITQLGRSLSRLKATVQIDADIPELSIRQGSYDIQRFIYDHFLKCFWNDDYDFETNAMINFDWYRPVQALRFRPEEIRRWSDEEGLELKHMDVSPSGISTIMQKPC
jgi:SAM-dependent methyltransferase